MRAEARSWDSDVSSFVPAAGSVPAAGEDEQWYVELAPRAVAAVSLEGLDQLFRLSIIDTETLVWQTGMAEWQTLGSVVSSNDDAEPCLHVVPAAPSVPPIALSAAPGPKPRAPSRARVLLACALALGLGVALYRSGAARAVAHAVHQDARYERAETVLRSGRAQLARALGPYSRSLVRSVSLRDHASRAAVEERWAPREVTKPRVTVSPLPAPTTAELSPVRAASPPEGERAPSPPAVPVESLALAPSPAPSAEAKPLGSTRQAAGPARSLRKARRAALASKGPIASKRPLASTPKRALTQAVSESPHPAPGPEPAPPPPRGPASIEQLNAAIGRAVHSPAGSASRAPTPDRVKSNSDYDPLNPDL